MKQALSFVAAALLAFLPVITYAGPIIRSGEKVSVDASQTLAGDFYAFGGTVTISGPAENDVYLLGGTITMNAPVAGDLTVLGGAVQIHGPVADDVRVVGGDVTIAESVKGDVVVLGGLLTVLSTATIEGDVIFMGGEIAIEGDVVGSVHGTSDKARINAQVGGNVTLGVASLLTLGDNAEILGDVVYESGNDLVRAQDARVGGDIQKKLVPLEMKSNTVKTYVFIALTLVFAAFSFFFIARNHLVRLAEASAEGMGVTGLIGLVVFLFMPFIGGVLFVSVIGSVLGGVLISAYIFAILAALIFSGVVVGYNLQKLLFKKQSLTLGSIFLGTLVFTFLALVPYIGSLLVFACFVVTLGSLSTVLYRHIRS